MRRPASITIVAKIINDSIASINEDFVKAGDDSNDKNEMTRKER
jgi:hypothetical protein